MAELNILYQDGAPARYSLDSGSFTIGRKSDCEIQIKDDSISRHHAVIERTEDNGWRIRDLGSRNGIKVDGTPYEETILGHDAELKIGDVHVEFTTDESSSSSSSSSTAASASASAEPGPSQQHAPSAPAEEPHPPAASTGTSPAAPASESNGETIEHIEEMSDIYQRIEQEFSRAIIGQRKVLEQLLIAIASNGHCLMIGLPGLAKTLMVRTLAQILQLQFQRVQFTPDLMPSDILGTDILDVDEKTGQKSFRFIKGPIFTNMLLGDEINRSPPKTQSALLESMQEKRVTVANHEFDLPLPFFVLATQNPLEQEGTYPLPEAQLDRFMFNVIVDYPQEGEEEAIVQATTSQQDVQLQRILTADDLLRLQKEVRQLPVSPHVVKYATRLARATRPGDEHAPAFIKSYISCGAGPRAAQFLVLGAKAKAVLHGRVNVGCADVRDIALPVLRHRMFTNFAADSEGITTDQLTNKLVLAVPEPEPSASAQENQS